MKPRFPPCWTDGRTYRTDLDAVFQKMVAKKPEDRYGSMTEVIAELEACAAPKAEQFAETTQFEAGSPYVVTQPNLETEDTREESLPLDFPVVSPVDQFLQAHPRLSPKEKKILTAIGVGALLIVLLLRLVFLFRTSEGTLVVTVSEPDAEISVDDGKITLTSPGEKEPVEVEVVEGKHTLSVRRVVFGRLPRSSLSSRVARRRFASSCGRWRRGLWRARHPRPCSTGGNWALEFDGKESSVHIPTLDYDGSHPITVEAVVNDGR